MLEYFETTITDGFFPLRLRGIIGEEGECFAVRVEYARDGEPLSWADSEQGLAFWRRQIEALWQRKQTIQTQLKGQTK